MSRMCHIQNTVVVEGDRMHVPVPGTQTNRRIGVQTVGEDGLVCHHSSEILMRSSVRNERGRAQNQRVKEVADMFTAVNYWCIPTESRQSNFLRYGPTLVAGLINNFFKMGKATVTKVHDDDDDDEKTTKTRRILRKGKFPWLNVDEILPCMTPEVVALVFNKANHKLITIRNEIKHLQDEIKERDVTISELTKQKINTDEELEKKKDECQELLEEKDVMERDMRVMKRAYKTQSDEHKQLVEKVTELDKRHDENEKQLRYDYDRKFQNLFSTLDEMTNQKQQQQTTTTSNSPTFQEGFTEDALEANLPNELEKIMMSFKENSLYNDNDEDDHVDFFNHFFQ
jgi:hypothetical protein